MFTELPAKGDGVVSESQIMQLIKSYDNVEVFKQQLSDSYRKLKQSKGVTEPPTLYLRVSDARELAEYLHSRVYGGPSWKGRPDKSLLHVLLIMLPECIQEVPVKIEVKKNDCLIEERKYMTRLDYLLLGACEPNMEDRLALLAFIKDITQAKEPDPLGIRRNMDVHLDTERLAAIVEQLLWPSFDILQKRVERILVKNPRAKDEVVQCLSWGISSMQQINKQLLSANQQMSLSLGELVKTCDMDPSDIENIEGGIEIMNNTRALGISKLDASLLAAKDSLIRSGTPEHLGTARATLSCFE